MTTSKATPRLQVGQVVALRGADGEWYYDKVTEFVDDGTIRLAVSEGRRKPKTLRILNQTELGLAALGSEEPGPVRKEVGNVLDHWEQVPNDLREDPGYAALHNAIAKLYNAVRNEPATTGSVTPGCAGFECR